MVVSKSRSSASLTVITPVAGVDGERQVAVAVAVGVARGDGPLHGSRRRRSWSTVTTAALAEAVSARLAEVSATVGATSVIVIVMSSVSAAVPSVAWTVSV